MIALPKLGKDLNSSKIYARLVYCPRQANLLNKVILKIFLGYIERKHLLNASQFGIRVNHSITFQCMRLTDHVTLNFNNNMSTAAVFLDIKKAFDTLWHQGLINKLSTMEFLTNLIKLTSSLLSQRKFRVSAEGKTSTPRDIKAGVPQGSILSPTLYNLYTNIPQTNGVNLALFADNTSLYAAERKEGCVLRNLQCWLHSMVEWCKHWNIKIN
jgi:hypothetical protein